MPSGYTAPIQDGKITKFKDYALLCARAFGACVTLRDEPNGAASTEIPIDTAYRDEAVRTARKRLTELHEMDHDQIASAAKDAFLENHINWQNYRDKRIEWHKRYEAMLTEVKAWRPPTDEHIELKNFMAKQIQDSIAFDCNDSYSTEPQPQEPLAWHQEALDGAQRDLTHHTKNRAEEIQRGNERNAWLKALHASLKE